VVALEHAAGYQQSVAGQADEYQGGCQQGLAGGNHEEVEEDQRVDPEQAVDPKIDDDQRGVDREHRGQVDAGFHRVAGDPGIEHGKYRGQDDDGVGDADQIVAGQQAVDGIGRDADDAEQSHQGDDRQLKIVAQACQQTSSLDSHGVSF